MFSEKFSGEEPKKAAYVSYECVRPYIVSNYGISLKDVDLKTICGYNTAEVREEYEKFLEQEEPIFVIFDTGVERNVLISEDFDRSSYKLTVEESPHTLFVYNCMDESCEEGDYEEGHIFHKGVPDTDLLSQLYKVTFNRNERGLKRLRRMNKDSGILNINEQEIDKLWRSIED